eukprot:TRINITY_DN20161_c0_g1_i1.p1 TRINITY_DN20161_c0_g1~~TRINITY_DN20161_c0_g1_i1.p1  ORF type:complete len:638 (+),score=90.13 TRINITY_DN20161_c0_g1_i1:77-1990(+)
MTPNVRNMFDKTPHSDMFKTTSKLVELARSGKIAIARKLFDEMPERDLIAWNAMLTSYSQSGFSQEALSLFSDMRCAGLKPDPYSFTAALSSSADMGGLNYGRKSHALVVSLGYQSSLPVCNSLLDMYGKCSSPSCASRIFKDMATRNEVSWCSLLYAYVKVGQFENARQLFDEMPKRNEIAYNILVGGYSSFGEFELAIDLFKRMQMDALRGDVWMLTSLMNACSEFHESCCGRMFHAFTVKSGWSWAVEVNNSILSFYAKTSCHDDAMKIFESIQIRTQVSWNAVIDAHMKNGDVDEALSVFRRAPENNIVTWTAMIAGYARNGYGEQALSFFTEMLKSTLQPDEFTFGAVLHACANLAVLGYGRMVHGSIIRCGFLSYVYVGNSLVNMYAKCGDIEGSSRVFSSIINKDLISWNTMLFGFGLHGLAQDALRVYEDMVFLRVKPDKVTFIGLLMTCSHSGQIEQGHMLFDLMKSVYGISQEVDHLVCMVDMLGRGGYLKEASELGKNFSTMVSLKASCWEALLGACTMHGNVGLGRKVGEKLLTMEPSNEMAYVLLSNLYCASGHWSEAEKMRKAMARQGVKKMPGYSWIEVRNKVMFFVAGDLSHPMTDDMRVILELLDYQMRKSTFISFDTET